MKVRDSGMPDEEMWEGFFDPSVILKSFGLHDGVADLVEFGCGYGTFTLPAAGLVSGTVTALDIEPEMVKLVEEKCCQLEVTNVQAEVRDFAAAGSGLVSDSQDAALLFNILHHEEPVALIAEALRILKPGGRLAVVHWNYDPATPRGPAMEIRPQPEQCVAWGKLAGFENPRQFDFKPYHYGLLFRKTVTCRLNQEQP